MIHSLLRLPLVYALNNRLFNAAAVYQRLGAECGYRPGLKVLDIGCGTGDFASSFRPEDYTGIDISPEYVAHARRRFGGTFQVLAAERVGEIAGPFDLAVMAGVFHHLSDDQVRATLDGLRRVLKPGGRFRVLEAVWPSRWYDVPGWLLRRMDRGRFVRSRDAWLRLLDGHGWHVEGATVTRNGLVQYFECSLVLDAGTEVAPCTP